MKLVKSNLATVRKYLEEKRRQIERRMVTLRQEDPFSDTDRLSDNAASDTEAREEVGHERVEALRGELMGQLGRVKQALAKIGIGKYGTCNNCGKTIESKRLVVFPMADYCLFCERELESKKR